MGWTAPEGLRIAIDRGPDRKAQKRLSAIHLLAKRIVAPLPDHETLTLSQIVALTNGKPSTAKLRLKELVAKGYILPKGQGRGAHDVRKMLR